MDVVINSQIQSPLVRTLARTKGKSQSFTHNIPDNVPPCSFSKINVQTQNTTDTSYNRNYKLKVPQYGYLRDVILKYTTREAMIDPTIAAFVTDLYTPRYIALNDVRVKGSWMEYGVAGSGTLTYGSSGIDLSWFPTLGAVQGGDAAEKITLLADPAYRSGPQFGALIDVTTNVSATLQSKGNSTLYTLDSLNVVTADTNNSLDALNYVGYTGYNTTPQIPPPVTSNTANWLKSATVNSTATHDIGPWDNVIQINGSAAMWSALTTMYYNIENSSDSLAAFVRDQLELEPVYTTAVNLCSIGQLGASATDTAPGTTSPGILNYVIGADNKVSGFATAPAFQQVPVTLPKWITIATKAGVTYWIPKIPQIQYGPNGIVNSVRFVPLHFMHPNDDAVTGVVSAAGNNTIGLGNCWFGGLTCTGAISSSNNFRTFPLDTTDSEWQAWDWQTESYRYPLQVANTASQIAVSTHNRPVQTIFPQETLARIQRLPAASRSRYLRMMNPRILNKGKIGTGGNAGTKVQYFPLFLASTENPSLNFDTRFVEQLDIDVNVNALANIYVPGDIGLTGNVIQIQPSSLTAYIQNYTNKYFYFAWKDSSGTPKIQYTSLTANFATITAPCVQDLTSSTALSVFGSATTSPQTGTAGLVSTTTNGGVSSYTYAQYMADSPRGLILSLRSYSPVIDNFVKVEALLYYHNFHDATAQAIRDSNYKPGTPASVLQYNTYQESERICLAKELQLTNSMQVNLTSNNLVFGTSFLIKRRAFSNPVLAPKKSHLNETLPVNSVTLTASGQQLYTAILDELQITDVWDFDLASGKLGRKYDNTSLVQAIQDQSTGETAYIYNIPYSFSSDMTYNSGSLAFQTLNNPVLTISADIGSSASSPTIITAQDNEFSILVFHNYWNMLRIDSNTGAVTRSLDL